jgi:hypothetical protein
MERNEIVALRDETMEGQSLLKNLEVQYEELLGAIDSRLEALGGLGEFPDVGAVGLVKPA